MHSIVYGNLRIEILDDVGSRLERVALQRVTPQLRGRQPTGPPSGELQTLLAREGELDRVRLAVQAGTPVELVAACGFGKTGLLRQLAAVDGGDDLTRPWVYLRLGKERLDDTLHRLFDASYTSPQPFKPTPEQRAQLLGQVDSVILLDDLTVGAAEVGQLVASLAGASVVVASTRPVLGRHGMSVNLAGLTDAAAVDLVAHDLGRPLTVAEEPAVRALAQAVDGQPLHLHQAAALAREDGRSPEELAARAARDPQVLDRLSVNALAERERRVLAVLALAGGALLPRELIGAIGDVATIGTSLGLLGQRGLIEQEQDRFGLPICHVNAYRELLQYLQLGGALGTMGDWLLAKDPTSDEARSAIGGAVNAIGYAAEQGQLPAVVRLVKVLEPVLTLAGRWEAARDVLEQGLAVARQLGDQPAEAWFSHQLGTLEVSLDELGQGQAHLEQALRLREQLKDRAGAAVSHHNLEVLDTPVIQAWEPPPRRRAVGEWMQRFAGRWPVLAGRAAVVGLTFLLGILLLPRGATQSPSSTSASGPTTTAASTTTAAPTTRPSSPGGGGNLPPPPAPTPPATTAPDTAPPVLRLPSDVVEEATSNLGARVRFSASAIDQVDGAVSVACTPSSGASFPLGTTLVTCSAVDRSGFAAIGDFLVTVLDRRPPAIKLPGSLTEEATFKDGAQVGFAASATDLVDGAVPVTCTPASGSIFPIGTTPVSCSASDAAGSAAIRDFTVRVRDTKPPDLTLPGDLLVRATSERGAEVTYRASASDVVDGAIDPTCAPASGELFRVGEATVNCSVTDKAGNKATGSFKVTVEPPFKPGDDVTPPVLKLPKDMTVEATSPAGATATYAASATDLVDPTVPVTCTPTSGSTFPLGTTTVDCSATDEAGNKATGSFKITVQDTTAPKLTVRDLTVEAASGQGTEVRSYPVSAVDLVDGKVLVRCPPGPTRLFPLGDSTVDCSVTDKAGNKATGSFKVTVRDTTAPEIPEMPDITAEATSPAGAEVNYRVLEATDRVDGPVPLRCTPAPGPFSFGTTIVVCSATDEAGNKAAGTFKVTVQDTTGPTITAPDQAVEAQSADGAQVDTYRGVSAVDLVDGPVTPNCSPVAPHAFRLGETTVDCTASDVAGNKATPASFKVIVEDTTPPEISVVEDMMVETYSPGGTIVEYETPAATDTVDHDVTLTCSPASNQVFVVDTTRVTCTATDDAGNEAERSFNVTVELLYDVNSNPGPGHGEQANPRAR
jgi:HYR domain